MSKPINTEAEARRLMGTCGNGFLAYWLEPIIANYHTLDSNIDDARESFVRKCHQSGMGFKPVSTQATRTRVATAMRLIEWGYARYALERIEASNRSKKDVALHAKATLRLLDSGELDLPFQRRS